MQRVDFAGFLLAGFNRTQSVPEVAVLNEKSLATIFWRLSGLNILESDRNDAHVVQRI